MIYADDFPLLNARARITGGAFINEGGSRCLQKPTRIQREIHFKHVAGELIRV